MYLIWFIITGLLAGFFASKIMDTQGGLLRNLVIGLVGAVIGGLIFRLLGFAPTWLLGNIIAATAGACLLIWLLRRYGPR